MQAAFATNMKCQSCLTKVGAKLDGDPRIKSWEADLGDPRKILRVEVAEPGDATHVVDRVAEAGFSASPLEEQAHSPGAHAASAEGAADRFSLATYKPLLLVLAYVTGLTLFAESIHGGFLWERAMAYFMGFFFLGFAFFKLLDISAFADAFATYDVVAARSRAYALAYPWIEVALGVLFLTRAAPLMTNLATAAVMAVGLVGVVSAVRKKQAIQCACLGTVFNLPMSVVTIVENGVMIAMATTMIARLLAT